MSLQGINNTPDAQNITEKIMKRRNPMKKFNFIRKLASGKGFYLTIALSMCIFVFAGAMIYRSSTDMLREVLTNPAEVTRQARQNKTDEADPRLEDNYTTAPTSAEYETSLRFNNTDAVKTTAAPSTEPPVINDSYILPAGREIIRDYSPDALAFDETMGDWRTHNGIDFSLDEGEAVKAVGNGRVTRVVADRSYGYTVEIDHGDFVARYCGLSQENAVKLDDTVNKGDTVGQIGEIPCEAAQKSHLHFETLVGGSYEDPMKALGITQ